MRQAIETAPKNGVFVILEDAAQGTFEVARWSVECAQWVDLDGMRSQLNATHWEFPQTVDELVAPSLLNATDLHPSAPAQGVVATAENPRSRTSLSSPSSRRAYRGASGTIAAFERATAAGRPVDVIAPIAGDDGVVARALPDHATAAVGVAQVIAGEEREHVDTVATAGDVVAGGGADRARASGGITARPQLAAEPGRSVNVRAGLVGLVGNGSGKILPAFAFAGGWIIRRPRGIASMAACLFVGVAFAILATELAAARREVQSQLSVANSAKFQVADVKDAAQRSVDEQRHALQLERDKSEKLTAALAEARSSLEALTRAQVAGTNEAVERNADEQRRALQVERDKAEKLTAALAEARSSLEALTTELAAAQREVQSQLSVAASAKAQVAGVKQAAERSADEQRRALQLERDKAEKLTAALDEARSSLAALTTELAAARREVQSQLSVAASAKAQVAGVKEAAERSADEQRRALQQERDKLEKSTAALAEARSSLVALTTELAAARQEVESQLSVAASAKAQVTDVKEAAKRSADEQRLALQLERDRAEKLTVELAEARSSLETLTKANAVSVKEAAERSADELRRAVQQERDKVAKLTAALAEARSSLTTLTKAKAADDVAHDDQLVTLRRELQKAKADAAVALELLEAEYSRRDQVEQRLAMIEATTRDPDSRAPALAVPAIGQLSPVAPPAAPTPSMAPTDAAQPVNAPTQSDARVEHDNPVAARLIARANLLLEQGNIGAARNMFDQAAAMGSAEALFWLAQTYDPLLLSARKTVGTQSDVAKARELYGKALAAGISEAKLRLDALRQ